MVACLRYIQELDLPSDRDMPDARGVAGICPEPGLATPRGASHVSSGRPKPKSRRGPPAQPLLDPPGSNPTPPNALPEHPLNLRPPRQPQHTAEPTPNDLPEASSVGSGQDARLEAHLNPGRHNRKRFKLNRHDPTDPDAHLVPSKFERRAPEKSTELVGPKPPMGSPPIGCWSPWLWSMWGQLGVGLGLTVKTIGGRCGVGLGSPAPGSIGDQCGVDLGPMWCRSGSNSKSSKHSVGPRLNWGEAAPDTTRAILVVRSSAQRPQRLEHAGLLLPAMGGWQWRARGSARNTCSQPEVPTQPHKMRDP